MTTYWQAFLAATPTKANLLLLDVAPDPVSPVMGSGGLILFLVIVVMLVTAGITGFVFVLKSLKKRNAATSPSEAQPNNPNQR